MNRVSRLCGGLLVLSVFCAGQTAFPKAYHPTAKEAFQRAEFIAVVEIDKVEPSNAKGAHFDYHQQSNAKVKQNIKGKLPEIVTISGAESFECAQCSFPVGEAVVLLKKSADLYVGEGWGLAYLPVKNGKVRWFSSMELRATDKEVDLKQAIDAIKTMMAAAPEVKP
jgi:hypothetical protein